MRTAVSVPQDDEVSRGVPVTMNALIQRINRAIAPEQQSLRITRDRWRSDLGDYYVVDFNRNWIVASHVNPEEVAREMGLLRSWESVK